MAYYDDLMGALPTEGDYPQYVLSAIQLARKADEEVENIQSELATKVAELETVSADLAKAQEENSKLLASTAPKPDVPSPEEELKETIKTAEEILDGGLELVY